MVELKRGRYCVKVDNKWLKFASEEEAKSYLRPIEEEVECLVMTDALSSPPDWIE